MYGLLLRHLIRIEPQWNVNKATEGEELTFDSDQNRTIVECKYNNQE